MATIPNENTGDDLVTVFSSMNHDGEMEAVELRTLLEANGIEATVVGPATIPSMEFQVQVRRAQSAEAKRVIEEAREAGPAAAEEAEAAGDAAGRSVE